MKTCAAWLTYGRQDLSDAMERQFPAHVDTFVIDNGSPEPIRASRATVLRREDNGFFTGGWNWAMGRLQELGYDAVWMLNDDVEGCSARGLDVLAKALEDDAKLAALSPAFNSPHPVFHAGWGAGVRKTNWIDWCCPLARTAAWKDVGDFDEEFKGYGADLVWSWQARARGWHLGVHDSVIIHHLGSQTAKSSGLGSVMCDNDLMDKVLKAKYGIAGWWVLAR